MKILAVSDIELSYIYSTQFAQRFSNIDFMISCGDLPYYYLEFMISMIDKPLYYVRGNHSYPVEITTAGERRSPWGAVNLHRRMIRPPEGILLAGIQGSLCYNYGLYQYSQAEMWSMAFRMTPGFILNHIRYGRFLDIFVTHAPPWKIHDMTDLPHQGIKAFRWLIKVFKPRLHLHGHVHVYRPDVVTTTRFHQTTIMNCYGYRVIDFDDVMDRQCQANSRDHPHAGIESDVERF